MDVVKIFPSLSATQVARLVKEEYSSSNMEVEVDDMELGLGLAILLGREELVRLGRGEVTCRRKKKGGRPIKISTNWVVGEQGTAAENLFHDPDRQPTDQERRHMMSLWQMILMVMGNHVYSFNGVNKLQLEGGPESLKLSGALAKICMLNWSRRFMDMVNTATATISYLILYMLQFYVDDTGIVVEELETGTRFREGTVVVVEEEVEGDQGLAGDARTARVLVDMANSIYSYLQFTADCPSLHPTGWLPLLAWRSE